MENFQVIESSLILKPYIKQYWFLKCDYKSPDIQRIIPTGSIDLMFHRGNRMMSITQENLQPQFFISGQSNSFNDIVSTGVVDIICVVFNTYGTKSFFDMPMSEIKDKIIGFDDMNDKNLIELSKHLSENFDNHSCVYLIEQFLLKRLYKSKEHNFKRMFAVIDSINKGEDNINSLADTSCLSYKQFKRVFSEYIGSNPKDFLKVVRFQRALYILQTKPQTNLTQLAFECGYYDQSHLIKDFKEFSGHTPSEFIAICAPFSDYFS